MAGVKKIGPGKRVVFTSVGKAAIESYSQRPPASNEMLVKTKASLISPGTESACLSGKANWVSYPHYPGYSNAGDVIMAVGNKEYAIGQRIYFGAPHQSYGLIQGSVADAGAGQTEGFVSVDSTALIPDGVTYEEAAFSALGAVALYGIRRAAIVPGESVVVVGLGIVGQLAVQLARLSGAMPVIGIDPLRYRRDLAERLGADETISSDSAWAEAVMQKVGGANVVLDATGLNQVLPQSIAAAGLRGRVVVLGSVYNSVEIQLFPGLDSKDVSLIGCHQPNNPYAGNIGYPWCQKRERKLFLDYVLTKRVKVAELITHRFKADEAVQAYKTLEDRSINKMGIILNW